jgi:soluble lytic murein transglycosylase-like protein
MKKTKKSKVTSRLSRKKSANKSGPRRKKASLNISSKRLSFSQVQTLVEANNNSSFTNELIISVCWKESSFDPGATTSTTSATGLMMLTVGAVDDVNHNTPSGVHFEHSQMTDATRNIQCGTWYLKILLKRWGQVKNNALEHFGTGPGYADNLVQCETCLQSGSNPSDCLKAIHP